MCENSLQVRAPTAKEPTTKSEFDPINTALSKLLHTESGRDILLFDICKLDKGRDHSDFHLLEQSQHFLLLILVLFEPRKDSLLDGLAVSLFQLLAEVIALNVQPLERAFFHHCQQIESQFFLELGIVVADSLPLPVLGVLNSKTTTEKAVTTC